MRALYSAGIILVIAIVTIGFQAAADAQYYGWQPIQTGGCEQAIVVFRSNQCPTRR